MTTCKHGINKKYCKVCIKQATQMSEFLFDCAKRGMPTAIELVKDIEAGKPTPDINERMSKLIDEASAELEDD
jgi:hypothetical protein